MDEEPAPRQDGIRVQAEIGALDEAKVAKAFKGAGPELIGCFDRGAKRVPFLSGRVRFTVRVSSGGATHFAFVKESTLGDHETERCMLGVLEGVTWPRPQGGEQGIAETTFEFPGSADERPPVEWSPAQARPALHRLEATLAKCRSAAGAGPLRATVYVETDGKPITVGVASSDEKGEAAIPCVVEALESATFPSPGSYASKVTFEIR